MPEWKEEIRRRLADSKLEPARETEIDIKKFTQRISTADVALTTRQLATLLRSGITLIESLTAIVDQVDNEKLKRVYGDVKAAVNEGSSLADALGEPAPCLMCAETPWQRCHRRLISELLTARGHEVVHLVRERQLERHRLYAESDIRDSRLYLCGELVA